MMSQEIIDAIKEQYSRDLRKQLVKSILKSETTNDKKALESSYQIINKIFSYIISQLGWNISKNTNNWDDTPLKIITKIFPKIETTQWFKEQQLNITKSIKFEDNFN